MPYRVDDDLLVADFVEDEERIGRCRQPANIWIVGSDADLRMLQEQVNDVPNALLDALCSLWGSRGDVGQNRFEVGECWECVA